jgi:hypothetical protein
LASAAVGADFADLPGNWAPVAIILGHQGGFSAPRTL